MNGTSSPEDSYLAPFEKGARALCQSRNEDPDALVTLPHPLIAGMTTSRVLWLFAAEEMLRFAQVARALHVNAEAPPPVPPFNLQEH
jgi:hypothetical protein